MRPTALVLFAAVVAGCGLRPVHRDVPEPQRRLTRADIRNAEQIVVTVGDSSPVSRSWHSFRCVLRKDGPCFGETTGYQEYTTKASERASAVTHEFPAETFLEVQKVLLESQIVDLKPGPQGIIFEGSRGVTVECGGRSLSFTWGQDGCKECQPLCELIEKLRAQGKTAK
jgi:hypothetical protein